jgi:serine/threonine protein kinase
MADLRTQLAAGLAGRYAIERELGRGGMATAFLAQDLRHDRPVALKVLHPELAATLAGLGLLFGWLQRHGGDAPGSGGAKLLAVLPFENLGSAEDEYFAARSSSNQYKKTTAHS